MSDHHSEIIFVAILEDAKINNKKIQVEQIPQRSLAVIKTEVEDIRWNSVLCTIDVNKCYNTFIEIFMKAVINTLNVE